MSDTGGELLNLLWTHLDARDAERQLAYLRALAPEARFVVCYGGPREQFDAIRYRDKLFIDDDSLRTDVAWGQSAIEMLTRAYTECVADSAVQAIYLFEYDHLVLRGDFEQAIWQLLERSGADFLAKTCVAKDSSNWIHAIRARRNDEFMSFLRQLSVRDDPARLYGCLGTGFVMRRDALRALVSVADPPRFDYHEVYVPTVLHHLGFRLGDIDQLSDAYDYVLHRPVKTAAEVLEIKRAGHFFVHPFKDMQHLERILAAPAPRAR